MFAAGLPAFVFEVCLLALCWCPKSGQCQMSQYMYAVWCSKSKKQLSPSKNIVNSRGRETLKIQNTVSQ